MNNYIKTFLMLVVVTVACYVCHYLICDAMAINHNWAQTNYTLLGMYFFGFVSSFLVSNAVLLVQWAMPKNLGVVFLGLLTLKIIANYIYINKGLNQFQNKFLEYNFLLVFFIFLIFDVYIAFRALNDNMDEK